eukprot:Seg1828.6 transcript_id=Seg1828.6/GoldUCD/mRNA.D3Y31 product="hypothetical protein" protein_id=Seg1828.6/GoldUCD/D3Y31
MEKDGVISSMEWKIKDSEATITVLNADRNRLAVEVDEMALRLEEFEYAEDLRRHASAKQQTETISRDSYEDEMMGSSDTVTRLNSQDSYQESDDDETENYGSLKRAANFSNINALDESADFQIQAPSILEDSSLCLSTDATIKNKKELPTTFDNNGNCVESFEEPKAGQIWVGETESMDRTIKEELDKIDDSRNEEDVGSEEIVSTEEIVDTEEIVVERQVFDEETSVDEDQIFSDGKTVRGGVFQNEISSDEEQTSSSVNTVGMKQVFNEKQVLDDEKSIGEEQVLGSEETVDEEEALVNDNIMGDGQTDEKSIDQNQVFDGDKSIDEELVFGSKEAVDDEVIDDEKQGFASENSASEEQVINNERTFDEGQNDDEEFPVKSLAPSDMSWEKFDRSDGAAEFASLRKKPDNEKPVSNFEETSNQAELTPFSKDAKKSLFMQIVESIPDSSVDESPAKSPELGLSTTPIPLSEDPWISPLPSPKPEEKPKKFSRNLFWEKNSDCNRYPFYSSNAEDEDTISKNPLAPFEVASTPSKIDASLHRDYFTSENEGAQRSGTLSPIGSQRSGVLSPIGSQRSGTLSPIGRDIFYNGTEEYQEFRPFAEEVAISESKSIPKEFSFDEESFSFDEVSKEPVKVIVNQASRENLFDFQPDSIVDVSTGQTIYESRQSDEETSSIPHSPKSKHNDEKNQPLDGKPIIDSKYLTSKLDTNEERDQLPEAKLNEEKKNVSEFKENVETNHSPKATRMEEREQSLAANHSGGNVSPSEQHSEENGLSDGSITPQHEREVSFPSTNSGITPQHERGTSFSGSNPSPERNKDANRSVDYKKKGLLDAESQQFVRKGSRKEREALNAYMQWKLNGKQGDPPVKFKISL